MAEANKELTKQDLPPLSPEEFVKYRNIYKSFLQGHSVTDITIEYRTSKQTIRDAVSYMLKYCDFKFDDEQELILARAEARQRVQDLLTLKSTAEQSNKLGVALNCMKEIRSNKELVYKLSGMLGLQIPIDEDGIIGITLITGINLASRKAPKKQVEESSKVIDITPKEVKDENKVTS